MVTVYADMVADLFHAGHVEFLSKARALGDELVVGVHSDADCTRMKRTPVLTLDERIAVVGACRSVDRVVPDAPLFPTQAFLESLDIDLVVHGDDWDETQLAYWYAEPLALGMVRTVPYTPGISSTAISARLGGEGAARAEPGDGPPARSLVGRVARRSPRLMRRVERHLLTRDLRRLHAVLETGPLAGRWWVWSGLLLGWAREGRPLERDLRDADFAYLDEDHDRFLAALPDLVAAGFVPSERFVDLDGRAIEHVLRRDRIKFEFFRFTPTRGDDGRECWTYYLTVAGRLGWLLEARLPAQPRAQFDLLGRTWRKVTDHEAELTAIYGDWRTPDPAWSFTQEGTIVERHKHPSLDTAWTGSTAPERPRPVPEPTRPATMET